MFCILEQDEKTFTLFRRYVEYLKTGKNISNLDNALQIEEVNLHLRNNGFCEDNIDEQIKWIERNGKPYRDYLNSIKLLLFSSDVYCELLNKAREDLTIEDIKKLESMCNKDRSLLESVF